MGFYIKHYIPRANRWLWVSLISCLWACSKHTLDIKAADIKSGSQAVTAPQEKENRTAAQKKLDSHLVLALKKSRGEPPFDKPTSLDPDLVIEADGRVQVDLKATVTPELLGQITTSGGTVISSFETMKAIRAKLPLGQVEAIAARTDVTFISPAAQAATNQTDKASSAPAGGASIHP